ncbi:hypothetical protein [Clostridium hydrogenum]|uniref:hypothetical protein n=1 Tax=Clostridium hydrogenum TaxID=2855764 RepID=UPI001F182C51|nr:hypothetical protein [Clostridium hydrogenum]
MKIYCFLIEKVIDDKVVDSREFLAGTTHYSAVSALNVIKRCKSVDMDTIEELLEKNNLPYLRDFNGFAKSFVRRKIKSFTDQKSL